MKRSREPERGLGSDSLQDDDDSDSDGPPRVDLRPVAKITELDPCPLEDDDNDNDSNVMRCSLPPHRDAMAFATYDDFESHYTKFHSNRCLECRRNFPSQHLLGVHIEECHDPLVVVRRDKGEHTYSCFVEGCERKCLTHQKRRMHMIDKHMYPKNYFFAVTKEGIDGRRSLLVDGNHRRRQSSVSNGSPKDARRRESLQGPEKQKPAPQRSQDGTAAAKPGSTVDRKSSTHQDGTAKTDRDMDDLTGAMSSLQFVPQSVRFGRGGRAGFSKK